MLYNDLFTNPTERTRVTFPFVWWDGAFTNEEIDKIVADCSAVDTKPAVTMGPNENIRASSIQFFKDTTDKAWIFRRLNQYLTAINNRWYGFDLNGYDSFQYTEYHATNKGKYDWHMDTCLGDRFLSPDMIEPRKLSLTFLLSEPEVDFKGGDFQFNLGNEAEPQTATLIKGRMIVFPSFMIHRVLPVIEGTRRSLVVWVVGPKFK